MREYLTIYITLLNYFLIQLRWFYLRAEWFFILFYLIQQYSSNTTYNNYSIDNTNDVYITYKATPNPP